MKKQYFNIYYILLSEIKPDGSREILQREKIATIKSEGLARNTLLFYKDNVYNKKYFDLMNFTTSTENEKSKKMLLVNIE